MYQFTLQESAENPSVFRESTHNRLIDPDILSIAPELAVSVRLVLGKLSKVRSLR